jgi:ASC-1-like (ASCH) protein
MAGKLKVSFNSPQCGWMSIGFENEQTEFHTTTAHAPHNDALPDLMNVLTDLLDENAEGQETLVQWNRDPEEFDFWLRRSQGKIKIEIWQYPTGRRLNAKREIVFRHESDAREVATAFYETFEQMYEDRETDEFEQNWRQPFPFEAFERFKQKVLSRAK